MNVTVIGYWGGYPAPNEATSCYIVEVNGFVLLVDMGSGALSKLQKYKRILDIDAVIISHYHHDHIADIGVLQYARLVHYYVTGNKMVLPIYGHTEGGTGFDQLTSDFTTGIEYNPDHALNIGPLSLTFLKTNHPVPCYGMRITDGSNTIVYTADTAYQESWVSFAQEADLLIADCNFYEEQDGTKAGHMTSKEAAVIAQKAEIGDLLLSHLPQYGDQQRLVQEAERYFTGNVHLAREGFLWSKKA
ncbi:MBL fold metallo-hydrolase [Virgibacillus sp. W0181]|uniref:MBL fold metallo-hydrolase n=1 Tax=Virgibacillus sp. W0181 TaxID=3391581 RepID=UPI003F44E736